MDIKYYVLGEKDNPMLSDYLSRYQQKLKGLLESLQEKGILDTLISKLLCKDYKDFILAPDISALINMIYRQVCLSQEQYLGDPQLYIDRLSKEIAFFLDGKEDALTSNKGERIPGTHIRLTTYDLNPYNQLDAHPDHRANGGTIGWGQASEQDWLSVYKKTFEILKQADEGIYDELNRMIKKIIPLGTGLGIHNSASHKECIGHLYMGYTIDAHRPEINNLEAIIHESSHNKLNLIMQFDPLLLNTSEEIYYSPYRPDARHLQGIYLGVHAIAPTVYILMRSYTKGLFGEDPFWLRKILLYHLKNKIGAKVLKKYLQLTDLGKDIFDEMQYVISLSDILLKSLPINQQILLEVQNREKEHFASVNKNYRYLKY